MRCPACPDVVLADDGHCRICEGIWLDEKLVREQAAGELEFTGGTVSERRCPVCDEEMDEPLIFDVPIDRCAAHGMWFDKTEHAELLHRARSDEWRLYGGVTERASRHPLTGLVDVIRVWLHHRR